MRIMKSVFTAACIMLFFSCMMSVTDESFASKMDLADSYIAQAQFSSAEKILVKAFKKAHTDFQFLGIYRRFSVMKKYERCAEVIQKAFKKNPESIEIRAVYSHFLIQQKRIAEAVQISQPLAGTFYGSLYAQARFLLIEDSKDFFTAELVQLYKDAYASTGNVSFIMNAAVIESLQGNYIKAMQYHPQKITSYDPCLFWACIAYDAGNYAVCLYDLSLLNQSLETEQLKADACLMSGELEKARESWLWVLEQENAAPSAYFNAASSTEMIRSFNEAGIYARKMVQQYPDYAPGLVYYGFYAIKQNKQKTEDPLEQALKLSGLKSLQMHIEDSFPKIPVKDAVYRIEKALEKNNEPSLQIAHLLLSWETKKDIQVEDKIVDIWRLLELNMKDAFMYDETILRYAVWFFLSQSKFEEAQSLLLPYIKAKYGQREITAEDEYVMVFDAELMKDKLSSWEREYLAYIYAAYTKEYSKALSLLEYEYSLKDKMPEGQENMYTLNEQLVVNLATMYEGLKYREKAVSLYSEVSSVTESAKLKSEIHYRLACINILRKETKNAVLNLEYSLSLDPDNSKSRLLLKKIR